MEFANYDIILQVLFALGVAQREYASLSLPKHAPKWSELQVLKPMIGTYESFAEGGCPCPAGIFTILGSMEVQK